MDNYFDTKPFEKHVIKSFLYDVVPVADVRGILGAETFKVLLREHGDKAGRDKSHIFLNIAASYRPKYVRQLDWKNGF